MNKFITYEDLDYFNDHDYDYIKIHDENEIVLDISHKLYEHKFIRIFSQSYSRTAYSTDTIKCIYCNYECILFIGLCTRKENLWSLFDIANDKIETVNVPNCISDEEKIIKNLVE